MVVFTDKINEAEFIEIWKQSFGDSEEYIRMFFEWNISKATVAAYEVDGKAVSVAYLLPLTYEKEGYPPISCRYLYAAATLPEYRGRGYFGEIMKAIHKKVVDPVLLVPGEKSLISYYEKQGMHLWLSESVMEYSNEHDCDILVEMSDISPSEYVLKREKFLKKDGYIKWDEHFMDYIFHENRVCGGFQKVISVSGKEYIAVYRAEGDTLKIIEILSNQKLSRYNSTGLETCVQCLLKETGCKKAQVCLQPTVMVSKDFSTIQKEGYFNLTLG